MQCPSELVSTAMSRGAGPVDIETGESGWTTELEVGPVFDTSMLRAGLDACNRAPDARAAYALVGQPHRPRIVPEVGPRITDAVLAPAITRGTSAELWAAMLEALAAVTHRRVIDFRAKCRPWYGFGGRARKVTFPASGTFGDLAGQLLDAHQTKDAVPVLSTSDYHGNLRVQVAWWLLHRFPAGNVWIPAPRGIAFGSVVCDDIGPTVDTGVPR